MFLDRARLDVHAGDGGRGVISFRREAHVPRGGPDGGDGGRGGDVVLRVDREQTTLGAFQFRRTHAAEDGQAGAGRKRSGKAGADLVLRIPPGTVVRDRESGETIADLLSPGEEVVVARGGARGRGNVRFVSSVRRVPRIAEDGQPGERRELELELKLVADVGLTGLPNAGKSTLLAALTRARPKVADYPFTTLTPNLGVARLDDRELVIADIPGLIEGAHRGAGLGEDFLRHLERTRLIVHVVDASRPDPLADIAVVDAELAAYGAGLVGRTRLFALNKCDLPEARDRAPALEAALGAPGREAVAISAADGTGIPELARRIFALCPPREMAQPAAAGERRIAFARGSRDWSVTREGDGYRVRGDRIERLAAGLDWGSPDASAYFQRLLARSGVERALRDKGAHEGDTVRVGELELEWREGGER
ncbi:MAG: GTPase ObgE [Chloroflexota bacterium]|nr:GTPase ObgE [Chloroflexota bacterium]